MSYHPKFECVNGFLNGIVLGGARELDLPMPGRPYGYAYGVRARGTDAGGAATRETTLRSADEIAFV